MLGPRKNEEEIRYPAALQHNGVFVHPVLHVEESQAALVNLFIETVVLHALYAALANQTYRVRFDVKLCSRLRFGRQGPIDKGAWAIGTAFHENLE